MAIFPFLLVIAVIAIYFTTHEERMRVIRAVPPIVRKVTQAAAQHASKQDPFDDTLSARTPWVLVTPALAIVMVFVFLGQAFGEGAIGAPATLVAWGANFGPRTTNGEWWRLVTSTFVHASFLSFLLNVAIIFQLGMTLERLVGHLTFALVFLASGIAGSLSGLYVHRVAVISGAGPAVAGLYGLFIASVIWTFVRRSDLTIPFALLKKLAPLAGIFVLVQAASDSDAQGAAVIGFLMGALCGGILTFQISECKPQPVRLATIAGTVLVVAAASAVPLRGVTDVRPEIERVIALEQRTSPAYEAAVEQFKLGRMKAEALAKLIERSIVPDVQAVRARFNGISGAVPPEYQATVADATEYLRLRDESWRVRALALSKHNMSMLREADRKEQAALQAFDRIKPSTAQ
jgi:membrane associated rhomboid family serine protease